MLQNDRYINIKQNTMLYLYLYGKTGLTVKKNHDGLLIVIDDKKEEDIENLNIRYLTTLDLKYLTSEEIEEAKSLGLSLKTDNIQTQGSEISLLEDPPYNIKRSKYHENKFKVILDPIHGFIPITFDISNLIDIPIFQRLEHIKQLSTAGNVFIGAHHTRKEHSIGAHHIASKYANYLFPNEDKMIKCLKISALFHDIGHGPYSHTWDSSIYYKIYGINDKGHDIHRINILNKLLKPILLQIDIDCKDIEDIWESKNKCLSSLIQGPLGVDRMDFIKRDTFYTGTQHLGIIDIDRIIYNSSLYMSDRFGLCVSYNDKIIPDVIQGLRSRLDMYLRVYLHKTVVASSILVELMMIEAAEHLNLIERTNDLNKFIYLADDFILNEIITSSHPKMKRSKTFGIALYNRKLPKMKSERKIELSNRNTDLKYKPIEIINDIDDDITKLKVLWRSRILTNDFANEFDKYNIHIYDGNNYTPFGKYWKPDYPISYFYIERIYEY